jgi:hypothetical protein
LAPASSCRTAGADDLLVPWTATRLRGAGVDWAREAPKAAVGPRRTDHCRGVHGKGRAPDGCWGARNDLKEPNVASSRPHSSRFPAWAGVRVWRLSRTRRPQTKRARKQLRDAPTSDVAASQGANLRVPFRPCMVPAESARSRLESGAFAAAATHEHGHSRHPRACWSFACHADLRPLPCRGVQPPARGAPNAIRGTKAIKAMRAAPVLAKPVKYAWIQKVQSDPGAPRKSLRPTHGACSTEPQIRTAEAGSAQF